MAQGVYCTSTLNDNWFEDRLQPAEALSATATLHKSKSRPYETDLANIGERYDVLSRISRMPPRPSYALPSDGFNEWSKTSLSDFAHPKSHTEFSRSHQSAPCLITTENAPVCPPERRPLPGPRSGFGAKISRHGEGHDVRHLNTTSGDFFGEGARRPAVRSCPSELRHAGRSTEEEESRDRGLKVGKLAGECFTESTNPAADTRSQRSWLYSQDASLRHIDFGGTRGVLPRSDSALSLPIGDGAMSKVRADLRERKGRLYRQATYITKGKGHRAGVSIFQDA
mmetsp:Transcript_113217/g.365839  ORF Transcript_113217/g.365839 Transcript_113217/m.365839 type:complete len:283 (+) Transcript_113217:51-899(+)